MSPRASSAVEQREEQIAAAEALIDDNRLTELCTTLVDIPSPTGDEGPLAETIARLLDEISGSGHLQRLDDRQANAWGRLPPHSSAPDGPTVMMYAPIDTLTVGDPDEDLPWSSERRGAGLASHQLPAAAVDGGVISGLGAMNPKGHAACVLAAFEAIARAGIPLRGELLAAFGAGGMPTNARMLDNDPLHRRHTGQGVGCSFLLEQGVWADAAIIAKTGWAISTEEVGLAWCDVIVRGRHTYVGARHRLPYRNPIDDAATVIRHVEAWLPKRAEQHRWSTLLPQGVVSAVDAGWWRMAAVVPAEARVRVDLRIAPDQSPLDAKRELDRELDRLRGDDPGLDVSVELVLGIPATTTDPEHWMCRAAVDAWEHVAGRPHEPIMETSGATDANILRNRGIPTVRIGLPKVEAGGEELDFSAGMNTVTVESMATLTRHLIRVAVDTTTRSVDELEKR